MNTAFFITNPLHIGLLTNFWGSYGKLILIPANNTGKKILVSDSRYSELAKECAKNNNAEYFEKTNDAFFWKNLCETLHISKLAIEAENITMQQWEHMQKEFEGITLVSKPSPIVLRRICKNNDEIMKIQQAAHIADQALQKTTEHFTEGISEKALAWIFEKTAREMFHAQGLSFDTIVAFAENSAVPHHSPTDKKLEKNMPILIDCGVQYQHYCSDMTRCFWFGEKNTPEYKEWNQCYQLVLQAQKAGMQEMKAGNSIASAEKKARETLGTQEKFFTHSFGHGVGLEIHELPWVSAKNEKPFEKNMVVTAEPGVYYNKKFGIRIEDILMITENQPFVFSRFPK